jgi:hypothetical protein
MAHAIAAGDVVAANASYEVVIGGDYAPHDFVPCRRRVDTNGPICAFLAEQVVATPDGEPA